MKLCSVILPSRARPQRCLRSIQSMLEQEPERNGEVDFLIRLDRDDPFLMKYHELFADIPSVLFLIGDRGRGYPDLWKFYDECAKATDAKWIMQWNDDAIIKGPWITGIANGPQEKTWMQCEVHRLGGSTYPKDCSAPFVILPGRFWEVLGMDHIPDPCDVGSINPLRKMGWTCYFLPGTSFHHQRDSEEKLEEHRRL